MKRLIGILIVVVVAAVIVTAIFATGLKREGQNETAESQEAVAPPTALQFDGSGEALDALIQSIFDDTGDDEFVLVESVESSYSRESFRTFDTAADLKGALEEDGSPLRLFDIPDEYELISAKALYDCAAGYEYTLVATETNYSGLTVKKYTIPDEGRFISSYTLEYTTPNGKSFLIAGYLTREMTTDAMGSETVESVTVDGMDDALLFRGLDGKSARLEMRRSLAEPIAYVSPMSLAELPPGLEGTPFLDEMKNVAILYACYSIRADRMDGDSLLALLSAA